MGDMTFSSAEDLARFEVFPTAAVGEQAAELPRPAHLTVTCSPIHGPDRSVELAARLSELGHSVTVHVAARMVRDRAHLDAVLAGMADAGADDLFLVAGDVKEQQGPYASAVELLPIVAEHPQRPAFDRDHRVSRGPPLHLRRGSRAGPAGQVPARRLHHDPDVLRPGRPARLGRPPPRAGIDPAGGDRDARQGQAQAAAHDVGADRRRPVDEVPAQAARPAEPPLAAFDGRPPVRRVRADARRRAAEPRGLQLLHLQPAGRDLGMAPEEARRQRQALKATEGECP